MKHSADNAPCAVDFTPCENWSTVCALTQPLTKETLVMNKFINFRDGRINVTSYRYTDHQVTTLDDLITRAVEGSGDYLTASFDAAELCKHPHAHDFLNQYGVKCGSRPEGALVVLDWDAFVVRTDNTVVLDIA